MSSNNDKKLSLGDKNLEDVIIQIFNETYEDFIKKYGEKHSTYIKQMLEGIADKVQKKEMFEGALASAHVEMGVVYGKSDKLPAILKHELYHVFNESALGTETSYATLPQRYLDFLAGTGVIRQEYEKKMAEYKERWKNEPEILESLLVDYDTFFKRFDLGDSEIEKWAEWFNSRTNIRDMKPNFQDLGEGFYMESESSGSFYDYYINICDMVSCLIPETKLIDMHLNTEHHKTDYSFQDMTGDFDKNYEAALDDEEKEKYGYPYLKILIDTKTIDENARKNDSITLSAIQSCMKTCFRAYLCKMNNISEISPENIKTIFSEIKKMQQYMVWNVDLEKMTELPCVQEMVNIQKRFKEICQTMVQDNPDIEEMMQNVDYTAENSFKKIDDGEIIANNLFTNNDQDSKEYKFGRYVAKTGKDGIKGNLYQSIRAVFGKEIFNLLFEGYTSNPNNELHTLYKKIESIDENDPASIEGAYNDIYSLYADRMDDMLKTDENSSADFKGQFNTIKRMQELTPIGTKDGAYIASFERILDIYKKKVSKFKEYIDFATQHEIKIDLERGSHDSSRFRNKLAAEKKSRLDSYLAEIEQTHIDSLDKLSEQIPLTKIADSTQNIGLQEVRDVTNDVRNSYKGRNEKQESKKITT